MLEALLEIDKQWFIWINSHHCVAMDWTMWALSQHWCIAAVIVVAYLLLVLRHEPRRWWLVLVGIALCFLLADRGSVLLFKNTVCRLRPCHELADVYDVYMFRTSCGGKYGFVSSHVANIFAVALFLMLRYWKKVARRWPLWLMILWGIAVSYSRSYLGKHYPGDVICGALFGAIIGLIVWWVIGMIEKKSCKNETK